MASMTFKHYTQSYGANTQASHWQAYQHTFAFNRPHTHCKRSSRVQDTYPGWSESRGFTQGWPWSKILHGLGFGE